MDVTAILREKSGPTIVVGPEETVAECARVLARHRIGAVLVVDQDGEVLGVLSERDIVRALAADGGACLLAPSADLMTRNVVFCRPEDSITDVMQAMTARRIRHLPVEQDGELAGIVSIGDVVKYRLMEIEAEAESLRAYIATG